MNAMHELVMAGDGDSLRHRASHLAELMLDEIQPRAVGRCEHEDEALWRGLQVAPRLFGDMSGMVVQHQTDLLVLRIGAVEFFQEADEVDAYVRVTDGFNDFPAAQSQSGQQR